VLPYLDTLIGFAIVMLMISLLITILTQMVSALINHRGGNLKWGLKTLFQNVGPALYPQLATNASTLSDEVLRHCLISDSWFSNNRAAKWFAERVPLLQRLFNRFQLATAIRPKELADILRQFAANPPGALALLPAGDRAALSDNITALLGANNLSAVRDLNLVGEAVAAAIPAIPGPVAPLMQQTVSAISSTAGSLEAWFGSMMDRAAQRFVMYIKLWTVLFGCLFAFGTGLNSISLLNELYSNSSLRTALVGASQQLTASATTVLNPQNTMTAALTDSLTQALKEANITPAEQPPEISTTAAGEQWIRANVPAAQVAAVLDRFNADSTVASQKLIQEGAQNASQIAKLASQSGFDILKFRWPAKPDVGYLAGVLATAALLSLGAPFWFNALKAMTNLRPVVASKEDAEQAA
jgi:hypothetical protein